MQKKLNEDFIDGYCEKFASKVTADFFKDGQDVITGKEILKVTPSKQVNFFVIKLLFRYWQEETKKLESPFFNYKHEEVRQAMIQFMNVLSQHIEINKSKFETLLNHAVKDTIYLAAMPQAYVEIDLDSRGVEKIADKSVEGTVKYLKIHKKEIQNFLSDMKGLTIDDVIDELPEEFDDFDTTEAVAEECKLLSEVLEISVEKVFSDDPAIDEDEFDEDDLFEPGEEDLVSERKMPKKTAPDAQLESEGVEMSTDDDAMTEEDIDDGSTRREEPIKEEKEEPKSEAPTDEDEEPEEEEPEEEEEPKKKVQPPVMLEDDDREDDFPEETINKQFEKEEESLAEHHEKAPKEGGILELISLNHRYMFIKELFRNDKNEFENALYELEEYDSFDESVEFLVQGYAKHNEWDMQSDEVKEFLKVLFRRFR
ncbi:hypothetical protein [Ekhidna sp.]|uniref:hypothetical protein n=1 Tax=Ekhidna sp. TaxID=2608089 RepID=UPI003B5C8ABF